MTTMSFDLSGKIEATITDALREVKQAADAVGVPFFVVGATARDIIFVHCYGISPRRRTVDVDLGIEISSWDTYKCLIDRLVSTHQFTPARERHRLDYKGVLPIDIIPYGAIAVGNRITWPPEHEIVMAIAGFDEAYRHAVTVRLSSDPELDIRVASLPGLFLLKLISWREQYPARRKDAGDLLFLMDKYEDTGISDHLFKEEQELLVMEGFDVRLASIRLLGRNLAMIADAATTEMVVGILDCETSPGRESELIIDMLASADFQRSRQYERIRIQLDKLREGFIEVASRRSEQSS